MRMLYGSLLKKVCDTLNAVADRARSGGTEDVISTFVKFGSVSVPVACLSTLVAGSEESEHHLMEASPIYAKTLLAGSRSSALGKNGMELLLILSSVRTTHFFANGQHRKVYLEPCTPWICIYDEASGPLLENVVYMWLLCLYIQQLHVLCLTYSLWPGRIIELRGRESFTSILCHC